MGRLKTREDLEKMFRESRERQRLKREELKLQRKEERRQEREEEKKGLPSNVLKLVKLISEARERKNKQIEDLGGVKKKPVEETPTEPKKTPQRALKQVRIWHNPYIERAVSDNDLYLTREELQEAEKRGEGKINWEYWDRHMEESRKFLQNDFCQ